MTWPEMAINNTLVEPESKKYNSSNRNSPPSSVSAANDIKMWKVRFVLRYFIPSHCFDSGKAGSLRWSGKSPL